MQHIDFEADTEQEALELALGSLGLAVSDITYEVIQKEKRGVFGIGIKEKARIRVSYKEGAGRSAPSSDLKPAPAFGEGAKDPLVDRVKKIVELLDPGASIRVTEPEAGKVILVVESGDSSHLIGKGGQNLQALQTIVSAILHKNRSSLRLMVDIDHYFEKKERSVVEAAIDAAERVAKDRQSVLLPPMNPFERRLVHMEVTKIPGIATESQGFGKVKQVRIFWKDPA